MKMYCFQLKSGHIIRTEQEIEYNRQGYCIDAQTLKDDTPVNGFIQFPNGDRIEVEDIAFRDKEVLISWVESSI